MNKIELLSLLASKDLPVRELPNRLPAVWEGLNAETVRTRVEAAMSEAPAELRTRLARLDLRGLSSADALRRVRETIANADVEPREVEATTRRLGAVDGVVLSPEDDRPVGAVPELMPLLEKARLFQVADLAGLDDDAAEKVAAEVPGVRGLDEPVVVRLVESGVLDRERGRALQLSASVYHLVEGNTDLTARVREVELPALGGRRATSTEDLAVLTAADWSRLIADAGGTAPEGVEPDDYGRTLADRFAALHPEIAFIGRLPRVNRQELTGRVQALGPLFERNSSVLDKPFAALDTSGMDADTVERLRGQHAELRRLVTAYPGLELATILDDGDRSLSDRIATVERRVGFIGTLRERVGRAELFRLDYSPGSDDLQALQLGSIGADEGEQRLVLNTLKAYQRSYALTLSTDDAEALLGAGYTSSSEIARTSYADFRERVPISDEPRVRHYWESARASFLDSNLVLGGILDVWWGLFDDLGVGNLLPGAKDHLRRIKGLDALFGRMSFCDCTHCQSLLSPAAYFVDLMKFVDEHVRPQFGTRVDHPLDLRTRRPDLWTLELSCANTNDRIPTLDIVAEILENDVARRRGFTGSLSDRAAVAASVYPTLATAVDSFSQPFHLPLARIRHGLAALDRRWPEVVAAAGGSDDAVASARLRLTPRDWQLVTTPDADITRLGRLYGTTFTLDGATLRPVELAPLLPRMQLSRDEMGELVAMQLIGAPVRIRGEKRSSDSVQNDIERLHGLTASALDRMHRLTRLRRGLGWSFPEVDRVATALGATTIDADLARGLADVVRIMEQLGTSADDSAALIGLIPRAPEGRSLFDRLFEPSGPVLVGGMLPDPGVRFVHPSLRRDTVPPPDPYLPRLLAGLGVDLGELGELILALAPHLATDTAPGFDPTAADEDDRSFTLSHENLSLLYRHARLARALGVTSTALFDLIELAGLPGRVQDRSDLRTLLDYHGWWKSSGYSLDDIRLITGGTPHDATAYPHPAAIAAAAAEDARGALRFRDTILAVVTGTSEQGSRELLAANPTLVEAVGGGDYRLVAGADLTSASITIPASATVAASGGGSRPLTPDEVRVALAPHRASEALARSLAAALQLEVDKLRALVDFAGVALAGEPIELGVRGDGDVTPIEGLTAELVRLSVLFRASEWTPEAIGFARTNAGLFGLTPPAIDRDELRALSVYQRLARRIAAGDRMAAAAPPTATDLRDALLSFDGGTGTFAAAGDVPLARVLGVSTGLLVGLRGRLPLSGPAALALDRIDRAARSAADLGVSADALLGFASEDYGTLESSADALAEALRSRSAEQEGLLERAEEPIREGKRDALIASLLYSISPAPFATADELYAHFLIDVEAGGCSTTSRVVAAISSVQLYVHRLLMNLEQDRRPPTDPLHLHIRLPAQAAAEWPWRKNYRVWEANRKVFLWPENYIEPDLRDDKTSLFEELEKELLQTELSDQQVLDAYTKYLKSFEELASLTIAGAYHEVRRERGWTRDVLHLFGVSSSEPPTYYYRTCEGLLASGRDPKQAPVWSPWRKIDVQISGRRVSPIVYRGRLHLFWPTFKTRPVNKVEDGNSNFAGYHHTMSAHFTTLRPDGSWSPPQVLELPGEDHFGPGRGVIRDLLRTGTDVPWLDTRSHPEPIDDYTLAGPTWDWMWLEPGRISGQNVLAVRFRNFLAPGYIDLFKRRIIKGWADIKPLSRPQVLCARGNELHYGSPLLWTWSKASLANLVIDDARLDVVNRDQPFIKDLLQIGLYTERIGHLRSGTELLAVPGSVEDAIVQVGPDIVLLQGSVTDDSGYVLRRIGTTLAEEVSRRLFEDGLDDLLSIDTQKALAEAGLPLTRIGSRIIDRSNRGKLDLRGAYGTYYRELFFHIPFLIANALNARGSFSAAQRWYHYIFDPTATEVITVSPSLPAEERARRMLDRVWRYVDFRGLDAPKLRDLLTDETALATYRRDPFNPHALARLRPSAYQKAVVMKYVDNLLDWGDHLFAQFTMESVNEALMLYMMASSVLGARPAKLGECGEGAVQPKTYQNIAPTIGEGEEVLVELETWILGRRMRDLRTPVRIRSDLGIGLGDVIRTVEHFPARRPMREPAMADADTPSFGARVSSIEAPTRELSRLTRAVDVVLSPPVVALGDTGAALAEREPIAMRPPEAPMFRGEVVARTRTGGWSEPLAASTTLGRTEGLGRSFEHVGHLPGAAWIGAFGWSIVRQVGAVFCVPANKDLLAFWDRVEDRLYKIRNCMDISGQKRELALFAPEIDPRLLVRMKAAGLSLEDVLDATSGRLPPYRFLYLIERAKAYAASLSSFGAALLSALEKKDSEEMLRLRQMHVQNLARMTTKLRRWEIQVAEEALAAVERQEEAANYRIGFYQGLIDQERNPWEIVQSVSRHLASGIYITESIIDTSAAITALIPQVGSPFAMKYGGVEIGTSLQRFGNSIHAIAQGLEAVAASTGLEAGFARRREGWRHQRDLASRDLAQTLRQKEAAKIRKKIAERALEVHETSLEQQDEVLELMDGKFTNLGLYTWLAAELRGLYRASFNNALALARLTDQAYRYERGDEGAPGLLGSYWDATRTGLLAGERLLVDLQHMERMFIETNFRNLEVDQPFALSQIAPDALVQLRETGECEIMLPELFFDLAYPGHYKRRIKAVRMTIPCITGPYVNVSATLTLENSWIRSSPVPGVGLQEVPPRRVVSVATSTAQNDAGVFDLSFRDERYMPFEGSGAISRWRLSLPKQFRQFDYQTINDVILSMSYTAEQDGVLRERVEAANAALEGSILHYLSNNRVGRVFSLRHDFSSTFTRLLNSPTGTPVRLELSDQHLPSFLRGRSVSVPRAMLLLRPTNGADGVSGVDLRIDDQAVTGFAPQADLGNLPGASLPASFGTALRSAHTVTVQSSGDLAPTGEAAAFDPAKLADLLVYVELTLS